MGAPTYAYSEGRSSTPATRRGNRNDGVRVAAQTYDGSVITRAFYKDKEELPRVIIEMSDKSANTGDVMFNGTMQELKELFELSKMIKEKKASVTVHREKSNRQLAVERMFK